jgi:hypothetical protein
MFEVRFANGDSAAFETLREARDAIRQRDVDNYRDIDVLPAEIFEDGRQRETFTSWPELREIP